MTHDDEKTIRQGDSSGSFGDPIGQLIRSSGPREAVASDRMERVRDSVHTAWRKAVAPPERRRLALPLARWFAIPVTAMATAAIVVAVIIGIWPDTGIPPAELARFDVIRGQVRVFDAEARALGDLISSPLGAGYTVETGPDGKAAVSLASGHMIRFDRDTRLVLAAHDQLILERGAVYLDSGVGTDRKSIPIHTPFGVARDVGTQFEVRLMDSVVRLRVREGLVEFDTTPEIAVRNFEVSPGSELTLDTVGNSSQRDIPVYGPDWDWTADLAPTFEIENRSLADFLDWISRENGWQLHYSDPVMESSATGIVLHGSIDNVHARQALDAVLLVTGVGYELQDGMLTVGI